MHLLFQNNSILNSTKGKDEGDDDEGEEEDVCHPLI